MSAGQPWTVDRIGHALPHPELRATFMREVSFTDVREIGAVLKRWVAFVEAFEAERPRLEQLRELVHENGRPPAAYTAGLIDVTPDELHSAADHNSRGVA